MTAAQACVIGLDLGTSGVKAVLLSASGRLLAEAVSPLEVSRPQPLWSEQNPADWWAATDAVMQRLRDAADPAHWSQVRAMAVAGQMHGAVLLNAAGAVLRPAILWNDGRSQAQCAELEAREPASRRITANRAMAGFTAPKMMWVAQHEPHIFSQVAKVLLPKDWLVFQLTGVMSSDCSDAAGTLWLDVARRDWSDTLLQATGLTRSHMPRLVEGSAVSAHLSFATAAALGLPSGLPVAGGAGDNAASAIGIGAIHTGDSFVSLGTSGVIFSVTDRHRPNVAEAVHAFCHALPGLWHQMAVMLSAASALRWVTQTTGHSDEAALLAHVAQLSASERAAAPLFLPYLSGERTPHNNADASGVFFGLRHSHGAPHLGYGVIEGVALGLRDGLDAMRRAGSRIEQLQLVGGGSRSLLWAQLLADALDVTVLIGQASNVGAALGAARLAQLCVLGATPENLVGICTPPQTLHACQPQAAGAAVAQRRQALYRSAYSAMQPVFRAAAHGTNHLPC